ncbi:MAG: endonuclease MutS2, partial [Cyanobacteria bacterium REEB65]|nr:endonuclease MutS2 [Cyanobacteria bacterium REEB65]
MDPQSLVVLEWPAVVAHLSSCAQTEYGRDLCREIEIYTDLQDVSRELELTRQARELSAATNGIPLAGIPDVRPWLRRAQQGGFLEPAALLDIVALLEASSKLGRFLANHSTSFPLLAGHGDRLCTLPSLAREIRRCVDPSGDLRDDASDDLARIRHRIAKLGSQIKQQVQALLHSLAPFLQEHLVTIRGDRYVLPVRAEHRSKVRGIVHDQSATGQTLYIEPIALLDLHNDLQQSHLEERDEIERILAFLTDQVAEHVGELGATALGLAEIDFVNARAALSDRWNGHAPSLEPGELTQLYQARHPLLIEAGASDRPLVPLDLVFTAPVVLLSGPNTGGKTVALKTLGLCTLLAQAGVHPPVGPSSIVGVYSDVFADIGDPQSLERHLSTFSGHVQTLGRILGTAGPRSLILLDELGAGTDPAEGAALATAIVEEMLARRCHLLATTHLGPLKLLGHRLAAVSNASMEFDPQTHNPTFRFLNGIPGRSNALIVARKLGLPDRVMARAAAILAGELGPEVASLEDLSRQRLELEIARQEVAAAKADAEALQRSYAERLADWQAERARLHREAKRELQDRLELAKIAVKEVIAELKGNKTGP